jgi:hypothetical protein
MPSNSLKTRGKSGKNRGIHVTWLSSDTLDMSLVRDLIRAVNLVSFRFFLKEELRRLVDGKWVKCVGCFIPPSTVDIALKSSDDIYAVVCEEVLHYLGFSDPKAGQMAVELAKLPRVRKSVRKRLKSLGIYI